MFNIRKNKKGFTLVELIVVIAILAILAGTAAGIGVGLINNSANKNALNEANLLASDLKSFILTLDPEDIGKLWNDDDNVQAMLEGTGDFADAGFKQYINTSDQGNKVQAIAIGDAPAQISKEGKKDTDIMAGEHKFNAYVTDYKEDEQEFTITFVCNVKGSSKFKGAEVIKADYTYVDLVG